MIKADFTFDDRHYFEGWYIPGAGFSGWDLPVFEIEAVKLIAALTQSSRYHEVIVVTHAGIVKSITNGSTFVIVPVEYEIEDKSLDLYEIGTGWAWKANHE